MDSSTNHRGWAEREGEFSPRYYAKLGPNNASKSLVTLVERYVDENSSILELGCSSGRHLAQLHENGFERLSGIDINDESFTVMDEYFPDLAATGTFYTGSIERVIPEFDDDAFDVVYSVETLQHIHPDDSQVFEAIARVTGSLLVTIENEGPATHSSHAEASDDEREVASHTEEQSQCVNSEFPLYRRHWGETFTDLGLTEVLSAPSKPDTIRAFRTPDDH